MKRLVFSALVCLFFTGCYYKTDSPRGSWARGCDLSWLSEMEQDGVKFYNGENGEDCIRLLREEGMNAVRLRVWVNHATGWSNKDDMLALAKRAAKAGQRIMIDIHYSDFFADPNHQTPPAAWRNYDYDMLLKAVQEHTLDVLYTLKEEGIKPEWVQIGNETPNGMLWPIAKLNEEATSPEAWERYAGLTTMGYNAAKEAFSDIIVIVHIDNAYEDNAWWFSQVKAAGAVFDAIALSHYPQTVNSMTAAQCNQKALANIRSLHASFGVPVIVSEVGVKPAQSDAASVLKSFVDELKKTDGCGGVFYWEPEVYGGWKPEIYGLPDEIYRYTGKRESWGAYNQGAFSSDGRASSIMDAFKD